MENEMQEYTGTKKIKARPMTRGEYNIYRGWELPADEDGNDEGYLVEYVDGNKSNHLNHKGYISWSPVDVFDRAYKKSGTPLDRLIIEENELGAKLTALNKALNSDGFAEKVGDYQFELMAAQQSTMAAYRRILLMRIKDLKEKSSEEKR